MAIIHLATLDPNKLELLSVWLPARPWFADAANPKPANAAHPNPADAANPKPANAAHPNPANAANPNPANAANLKPVDLERVGAARFDDPAGEVGVEILVVRDAAGGPLIQVPLTYRAEPLAGAERWLIGTTEHSVLGRRWVYDGCGDPVFVAEAVRAIRTGGREVAEFLQTPDGPRPREPLMSLRGGGSQAPGPVAGVVRIEDGDPATVFTTAGELSVRRILTEGADGAGALTLTAAWAGRPEPILLATLR